MEDKVVLDKETFKALAVDTRVNILKLLTQQSYTLSDFSSLLALSNSTVKEHLDVLVQAGLISADSDGRKWKYYSLTFKGRRFIQPGEVKVFFAFTFAFLAGMVATIVYVWQLFFASSMRAVSDTAAFTTMAVMESADAIPPAVETTTVVFWPLVIAIVFGVVSAFLLGWLLRKPIIIISTREQKNKHKTGDM